MSRGRSSKRLHTGAMKEHCHLFSDMGLIDTDIIEILSEEKTIGECSVAHEHDH